MKCPKCGYLGFEDADRCRNCGYDFSLSAPVVVPELPLRLESSRDEALADLALSEAPPTSAGRFAAASPSPETNRVGPPPADASRASERELPLFGSDVPYDDDEPLIKQASAPRTPLSVRRSTPEMPRVRPEQPRAQSLDLTPDDPVRVLQRRYAAAAPRPRSDNEPGRDVDSLQSASVFARLVAVAIDAVILAAVDALVIYFTLRICGLTVQDLAVLPRGPMIAFLLVQNGGYLVAFTAGGQTLGKMATGIRVVASGPDASLDVGHAFVREALWLLLAAPVGLGFLTALFSRDGRGLHDRLAGTRVVR